jgi:23S rRNA pseudouridine2605 synthase
MAGRPRPPRRPSPPRTGPQRVGVARALSKLGFASRTAAAALVRAGRVSVNGRPVADPEFPTTAADRLAVDGQPVTGAARRYLMLNKPRGLVTTASDERGRDTVYACLGEAAERWLAPVGRLDKASEGLLLFTNDTDLAHRLLDPASHLPKLYHVQVDRLPDPALLYALCAGVEADGERLAAQRVELLRSGGKNAWLAITLAEGRNRHIRRLLAAFDLNVLRLIRVAIGPLTLGDLAKGQARPLTPTELVALQAALDASGKTHQ